MKMQFSLPKQNFPNLLFSLQWFVLLKIDSWWHEHYIILKLFSDSECLPLWNFGVGFVGQMDQFISSGKTGENTMLYHLSKTTQFYFRNFSPGWTIPCTNGKLLITW